MTVCGLDGDRSPHVLIRDDAARSRELLAAAAAGLGRIRAIGAETGLDQKVVRLGASDQWLKEFLGTPERIGLALDTPAPV